MRRQRPLEPKRSNRFLVAKSAIRCRKNPAIRAETILPVLRATILRARFDHPRNVTYIHAGWSLRPLRPARHRIPTLLMDRFMRFRTFARLLLGLLTLVVPLGVGLPSAQSQPLQVPSRAISGSPELDLPPSSGPSIQGTETDGSSWLSEILDLGKQLEAERRWNDALSHYEQAVRQNPGQRDLEFRLDVARIHVDLARRYADSSFTHSVRSLSERDVFALYSEVLLKVQTHYVDNADWRKLVLHGALTLDLALEDPAFLRLNGPRLTPRDIESFRGEMRKQANGFRIADRREAYNAAAYFARRAQEKLKVSTTAAMLEFVCGALNSLDEYSAFLTGAQLDEVFSQIEGNFVGLGIELKASEKSLLIVHVIPGGPASEAGMRAGDRIIEVDGRSTSDISTDEAADMLKGPDGSEVTVRLVREDDDELDMRMARRRVDVPSVDGARMIDAELGVGYLRLTSFQKTTSRDLDAALWQLHRQGMRSLIIDLRGNPGGLLSASVEVADKFLNQGAIVSTRGRSSGEDFDYRAHTSGTWRLPLVVLIDQDSASASEIFAGAIRDHRRGVLVGQRSYGKGSVQGIFPLQSSQVGVRLTTAKFYSPSGQPISRQGIVPDLAVVAQTVARPADGVLLNQQEDPILRAALQAAREQFSQR
jgi:carboxyl-terminal processing protease